MQQADTGTHMIHMGKKHEQHHHIEGDIGKTRPETPTAAK